MLFRVVRSSGRNFLVTGTDPFRDGFCDDVSAP
jgi:hypothetical protein